MSLAFDKTMHHLRFECDGPATPSHCEVAIDVVEPTRQACFQKVFQAGWYVWDNGTRALCPSCFKRNNAKTTKP